MRLASKINDFWELRSGEASHLKNPDKFWIPPLDQRSTLKVGQAAKLIFEIEHEDDGEEHKLLGERIWVIVSKLIGNYYIGILDNQPASIETSDDVYLCFGAEIPFLPEHVIDIANPPEEYVKWQLGQKPERIWPRD